MTARRTAPLLAAGLLLPSLMTATAARAQVGLGAERYEVTITPPKRPGTEAPVDAEGAAAASPATGAPEGAAPAANDAADPAAGESAPGGAASPAEAAAPTSAASAAPAASVPAASAPAPSAKPVPSNLPPKTLQVGAFRQKDSAADLRDKLAAGFPDVAIVEVQSGGEPLYRVIVGRLPRGPGLDDLKRRLAAAGHPAFEVPAPPPSGSR